MPESLLEISFLECLARNLNELVRFLFDLQSKKFLKRKFLILLIELSPEDAADFSDVLFF